MMGGASRFIILLTTPFPFLLHGPHHRPSLLGLARHSRHSRLPSSIYLAPLSTSYHLLTISPTSPRQLSFLVNAIHTRTSTNQEDIDSPGFPANSPAAHPWPEWSRLIDSLSSGGYFDHQREAILIDDEFVAYEKFSDEFVRASSACLAFARDRSDILGLLPRTDIGVVVENGTAFLFKSALDTARRMRAFLGNGAGNELDSNKAHTVDLMKYLLSYVSNPTVSSERSNMQTGELIESAVRNLLSEFTRLGCGVPAPGSSAAVQHQFPDRYGQTSRPIVQNMEMKKGDWICPRCTFVNFARNVQCLECKEARPKRQLVGGEWECPQCDFVNYGKNLICLRCDCKRPRDASFGITNSSSVFGHGNGLYANKPESASDLSNAAADEDFPEIMPLRKGVNRFVVSTRKTPLERKLANSQFQRDAANTGSSEILFRGDKDNVAHVKNAGTTSSPSMSRSTSPRFGHPKGSHSSYVPFVPLPNDMFAKNSEKIEENERVVTDTNHFASLKASEQTTAVSVSSETSNSEGSLHLTEKPSNEVEKSESWFKKVADLHDATEISDDFPEIMPIRKGENRFLGGTKKDRSLTSPMYKRRMAMEQTGSTTNFVPFVPFPPDYFAKKDNQKPNGSDSGVKATGETSSDSDINNACKVDNPQTSFRESNLESSGENLNERKSRDTYGSPISGNPRQNSFDSQSNDNEDGLSTVFSGEEKRIERAKSSSGQNLNERKSHITYGSPISGNPTQNSFNAQINDKAGFFGTEKRIESTNLSSGENLNERKSHVTYGSPISGNPTQSSFDSLSNKKDGRSIGFSHKESRIKSSGFSGIESRIQSTDLSGRSTKQQENQSVGSGWTGKSLEGSAVQEPDPLDMSEEAKAQRWFRRVAQIKDISELSQIPDEDFPSIMPMRKGVNRFVVSKRKTPLERRLTSPQYRRNLPVVSMDQQKKENENS